MSIMVLVSIICHMVIAGIHKRLLKYSFRISFPFVSASSSNLSQAVKSPPTTAGNRWHEFHPWVKKTPGGEHGSPLQYSCLEDPMDRGAWRATVHGVTENRRRLKRMSTKLVFQSVVGFCLIGQTWLNSCWVQGVNSPSWLGLGDLHWL